MKYSQMFLLKNIKTKILKLRYLIQWDHLYILILKIYMSHSGTLTHIGLGCALHTKQQLNELPRTYGAG